MFGDAGLTEEEVYKTKHAWDNATQAFRERSFSCCLNKMRLKAANIINNVKPFDDFKQILHTAFSTERSTLLFIYVGSKLLSTHFSHGGRSSADRVLCAVIPEIFKHTKKVRFCMNAKSLQRRRKTEVIVIPNQDGQTDRINLGPYIISNKRRVRVTVVLSRRRNYLDSIRQAVNKAGTPVDITKIDARPWLTGSTD